MYETPETNDLHIIQYRLSKKADNTSCNIELSQLYADVLNNIIAIQHKLKRIAQLESYNGK